MAAKTNRKANGIANKNGALRVLVVGLAIWAPRTPAPTTRSTGSRSPGCAPGASASAPTCRQRWSNVPRFADFDEALETLKPDVVSINTWPDTHADYAIRAFEAGAHVFMEKPIAETVEDAERVVATARGARPASWSSATSCASTRPG